jgi:hypothetical protein
MEEYIPDHSPSVEEIEMEVDAWRHEFEQKPYFVRCKTCSAPDLASEQRLREKGWALSGEGVFCPSH